MDRRILGAGVVAGIVVACVDPATELAGEAMRDAGEALADAGMRMQTEDRPTSDAGTSLRDAGRRMMADAAIDAGSALKDAGAAITSDAGLDAGTGDAKAQEPTGDGLPRAHWVLRDGDGEPVEADVYTAYEIERPRFSEQARACVRIVRTKGLRSLPARQGNLKDVLRTQDRREGDLLKMFDTGGTIAAGAAAIAAGRIVVASGLQYSLQDSVKENNQIICYGLPGDEADFEGSGGSSGPTDPADGDGPNMSPTWSAIWEEVVVGTGCNGGTLCHGGTVGNLQLTDKDASYAALVGAPARGENLMGSGPDCVDSGLLRVAPRQPDASLLMQKLDDLQPCGTVMPPTGTLSAAQRDQVRTWIANGANDD